MADGIERSKVKRGGKNNQGKTVGKVAPQDAWSIVEAWIPGGRVPALERHRQQLNSDTQQPQSVQ